MVCLPRRGGIPVGSALVRDVELRLPLSETVDFLVRRRFPSVIPSGARIFSRAESRDQRG